MEEPLVSQANNNNHDVILFHKTIPQIRICDTDIKQSYPVSCNKGVQHITEEFCEPGDTICQADCAGAVYHYVTCMYEYLHSIVIRLSKKQSVNQVTTAHE